MIDFSDLYEILNKRKLSRWVDRLPEDLERAFNHGDLPEWKANLDKLPDVTPSIVDLNTDLIKIGKRGDLNDDQYNQLYGCLKTLMPWRKGPFNFFDIFVDSEWRSDWKWNRLKDYISPLEDKFVLDIGCGNGYHCFRMAGEKARAVIGIDPSIRNLLQFQAVKKYTLNLASWLLPIGIEHLPENLFFFQTVFSMGVLYHRKSPIDHLFNLKATLRDEGELVLETIVIDGKLGETLVPEGRYAQMRNVYFLPSILTMESWMRKARFKNIRVVDVTKTTVEEQRKTEWMEYSSLASGLDPNNGNLTVEGHPAPKRAVFIANK